MKPHHYLSFSKSDVIRSAQAIGATIIRRFLGDQFFNETTLENFPSEAFAQHLLRREK
jgi:hypothetical protein